VENTAESNSIYNSDGSLKSYEFNCSIVREFDPQNEELTGIPLSKDEILELSMGYKAYRSPTWRDP